MVFIAYCFLFVFLYHLVRNKVPYISLAKQHNSLHSIDWDKSKHTVQYLYSHKQ